MNEQRSHEVKPSNDGEGRVSPDYRAWESIWEATPSVVASILDFLGRRTIAVAVHRCSFPDTGRV